VQTARAPRGQTKAAPVSLSDSATQNQPPRVNPLDLITSPRAPPNTIPRLALRLSLGAILSSLAGLSAWLSLLQRADELAAGLGRNQHNSI
jgi:hypothetical protein